MKELSTDILIVGAGGAGLRAALSAYEKSPDLKITVISRGKAGYHGVTAIACSDRMAFHVSFPFTESEIPGEAWIDHAKDIYEGGGYVSDPNLADILARNSSDAFEKLKKLDVPFVCDETNQPEQFITDGSKYARACYTGPYTARDIQSGLLNAVEKTSIELIDNLALASILKNKSGDVTGALCVSETENKYVLIQTKAIIIATGGPGGLFESNVFPERMDASPWFAAIRAGATLVNLEFIQFGLSSPKTSLACSGSLMRALPHLVSDGKDLLNDVYKLSPDHNPIELLFRKGSSWPISSESPSRAVDIAVWNARSENKTVALDFTVNPEILNDENDIPESVRTWYSEKGIELFRDDKLISPIERLRAINPDIIDWFTERGVDPETEPLEIRHAAQHFQGGILINTKAETGVKGLYTCGEAAGGQHGANRPGGNALMDSQVMGHIAGNEAAEFSKKQSQNDEPVSVDDEIKFLDEFLSGAEGMPPSEIIKTVRRNLSMNLSVKRSTERLQDAEEIFGYLFTSGIKKENSTLVDQITAMSSMVIGMALTRAAKDRTESRGPHFYFVSEDDNEPVARNEKDWRVWNAVTWDNVYLIVTKRKIPEKF